MRMSVVLIGLVLALSVAPMASATVWYAQNFDGLTLGSINGQDSWGGAYGVVENTTVVSGKAVQCTGYNFGRSNIFADPTGARSQRMEFDFLMPSVITDYAGTPGIDIQQTMVFRGPTYLIPYPTNDQVQFAFVYKAGTNGAGTVTYNNFEFRGATTVQSGPAGFYPAKNTWYHVIMDMDFIIHTLNGKITDLSGNVLWDPAIQSGFQLNGNRNNSDLSADGDPNINWYMDNFQVTYVPEPATLALVALGALGLMTRRRA